MMKVGKFDSVKSAEMMVDWSLIKTYFRLVEQGRTFRNAGEVIETIIREEHSNLRDVQEHFSVK